jgi:SpoVK/Ycf46/Vps4 family AAA+-type ATPase
VKSFAIGNTAINQTKYLTYSGLLNALDGVLTRHEGVITILTTNHIDRLGEAFMRPGRIDRKFKLGKCNDEQICDMTRYIVKQRLKLMTDAVESSTTGGTFEKSYSDINSKYLDEQFLNAKIKAMADYLVDEDKMSNYTPAEFQQYLIRNIRNIDDIFNNVSNIKNYYDYDVINTQTKNN